MFEWLKHLFNRVLKAFKAFLAEALPISKQIIMGYLKDFALETVLSLDKEAISNEQKRTVALQRISKYAQERGIEAKESLINTLIEIAIQKIKGA